jgi:hypothetical protein
MPLRLVNKRVLIAAFVVAVLGTGFFTSRLVMRAMDWDKRFEEDHQFAPWMTPKYIVHSWDVPRDLVGGVLGLESGGGPRVTLKDLAERRGVPVDQLIAELEAEIALYRAGLWQAPERKGGKKSEKPERKTDAEPGK